MDNELQEPLNGEEEAGCWQKNAGCEEETGLEGEEGMAGKIKAASRDGRLPLMYFFAVKDYSHSIVALGFGDIS